MDDSGAVAASDLIFTALANPTRRAIFERLYRSGEQRIGTLKEGLGVSRQQTVKHLGVLQLAGLVTCRREGSPRHLYYSASPQGAAPILDWFAEHGIL
jgi:DNA-binding transcriptional ArsR family regulator